MAGLGNRVKLAWLKGMEAVGKGASNMASTAHQKVAEINLETRRREILSEFPMRAFDLWQKGVELPDPLGGMMAELSELDERLSVLRAQRYARIEGQERENGAGAGEENAPAAAQAAGEDEADGEAPAQIPESTLMEAAHFGEPEAEAEEASEAGAPSAPAEQDAAAGGETSEPDWEDEGEGDNA